jgi:hypothetical protein
MNQVAIDQIVMEKLDYAKVIETMRKLLHDKIEILLMTHEVAPEYAEELKTAANDIVANLEVFDKHLTMMLTQ